MHCISKAYFGSNIKRFRNEPAAPKVVQIAVKINIGIYREPTADIYDYSVDTSRIITYKPLLTIFVRRRVPGDIEHKEGETKRHIYPHIN